MAKINTTFALVFLVVHLHFCIAVTAYPTQDSLVKACQKLDDKNKVENCLQFVKPYIGKADQIKNIRDVAKLALSDTMATLIAARDFTLKQAKTKGLLADQAAALKECLGYQVASVRHLRRAEIELVAMAKTTKGEAQMEHKRDMELQTEEAALRQANCIDVFEMGEEIPLNEGLEQVWQRASDTLDSVWNLQLVLESVDLYLY